MPINNDLPDKNFPMEFKWGEKPITDILHGYNDIKIKTMQAPERLDILKYISEFCLATWEDKPTDDYTLSCREQTIKDLFNGKVLPNMLETIRFTFLISNIDLITVTHLIRHRNFTFSAHCTGDRDQRHDSAVVKPTIISSDFFTEYMEIVRQCKDLYAKMVDSKKISILHARDILPRGLENHYYASANLKDLMAFFRQRMDKQIQPETDNIIALRTLIEVAKVFPEIGKVIKLSTPDHFFIKTAQQDHSSNLYHPEAKNDIFEWKPQWFIYNSTRDNMPGNFQFRLLWDSLSDQYNEIVDAGVLE